MPTTRAKLRRMRKGYCKGYGLNSAWIAPAVGAVLTPRNRSTGAEPREVLELGLRSIELGHATGAHGSAQRLQFAVDSTGRCNTL